MTKKEVTINDAAKFWELLDKKHPEIGAKITNRQLVNGDIFFFQPKVKDDHLQLIFNRFLARWLSDNGFAEPITDTIEVSLLDNPNNAVMSIPTDSIVSIESTINGWAKVIINDEGELKDIYIKENAEQFRKDVYIF